MIESMRLSFNCPITIPQPYLQGFSRATSVFQVVENTISFGLITQRSMVQFLSLRLPSWCRAARGLSSRVHALAALSFVRPSPCHFRAVNTKLPRTSRVRCHLPRSKCGTTLGSVFESHSLRHLIQIKRVNRITRPTLRVSFRLWNE